MKSLIETTIETKRLSLKPISLNYADEMFVEFDDGITLFMYPRPAKNITEIEKFIEGSMQGLKHGSNLQLVVLDNKTNEFFGCVGLHHLDRKDPELGVWIKKSAHGKSLGKEAIHAVKKWADKNVAYDYLLYPVAEDNIPSIKIAESLKGKAEREYEETNLSGKKLHILEYRIYNQN